MNNLTDLTNVLDKSTLSEISILSVIIALALTLACSWILRYYYIHYSNSFTNKRVVGDILPLLSLITFFVIMIVKSSLALSLGLVGALSIVRFRTPVKEPEDLVYLFFAITLGLGMGASQIIISLVIFFTIMLFLTVFYKTQQTKDLQSILLSIELENSNTPTEIAEKIQSYMITNFAKVELRRVDLTTNSLNALYAIFTTEEKNINQCLADLIKLDSKLKLSLLDTSSSPSL